MRIKLLAFSGLNRSRLLLLAGNMVAQGIALACIPLISRMYLPATIGAWSEILVLTNILWSFSQFRTDLALFQATSEAERTSLFRLGLIAHSLVSVLFVLVFTAMGWVSVGSVSDWFLTLFLLQSHGFLQMSLILLAAKKEYSRQNTLRLTAVLLAYPGAIILRYYLSEHVLIIALLIGNIVPLLFLGRRYQLPIFPLIWDHTQWRILLKKYRKNSIYLSLGNLFISLSDQALVLLVARVYSPSHAAACFFALRICGAPLSFVMTALSQYNYRHFQDLQSEGAFTASTIIRHWLDWIIVAFCFFVPIIFFGAEIFSFFLGKEWNFAGQIASVVAVWAGVKFLVTPTSMGYFVIGKTHFFFAFAALLATTVPICFGFSKAGYSILGIMKAFVIIQVFILMGYNALMLYKIDQQYKSNRTAHL